MDRYYNSFDAASNLSVYCVSYILLVTITVFETCLYFIKSRLLLFLHNWYCDHDFMEQSKHCSIWSVYLL